MSLILDALRKSDHQRARNVAERLREGPPVAAAPRVPATVVLLLVLAVATCAAVVVSILLTTSHRADNERIESAVNDRPSNPPAVRALGSEVVNPRAEAPPEAAAPAPAATNTAAAQTLSVDELAAPPVASLPPEMRARLPELSINVHAWAEDPSARFVLINLKRYQEGDRLVEGPQVRHILRDGVVLEFEGILFSLPRR